jgi:hypothetical protein
MQSFQKLVILTALMLFTSKEATALPQPHAASSDIGSMDHQVGVASHGNINLGSVNARDELGVEDASTGDDSASASLHDAYKFFGPLFGSSTTSTTTTTTKTAENGNNNSGDFNRITATVT